MSFIGQPVGGLSGLGSTDNAIVRTNGTIGNAAQGSLATIDDSGIITAVGLGIGTTAMELIDIASSSTNATNLQFANTSAGGHAWIFGTAGSNNLAPSPIPAGAFYLYDVTSGAARVCVGATGGVCIGSSAAPAANTLAQRNGTADQTLSLGAASGTGGGVILLHGISVGPSPVTPDVAIYYDGFNCIIDKPIAASGSGITGVPGAWTIGSGWTANADGGDKTAVIPSSATIATIQTAANILAAGLGDLIAATAQKVKALEATAVNLVAPNN